MTISARKYLRLCWREGWGLDVVVLYPFWNTHIFLDWQRSLLGDYNHFYVFSFIRIYLFIFLTSWIFIPLLVFSLLRYSLLVTSLLCLVTPVDHVTFVGDGGMGDLVWVRIFLLKSQHYIRHKRYFFV